MIRPSLETDGHSPAEKLMTAFPCLPFAFTSARIQSRPSKSEAPLVTAVVLPSSHLTGMIFCPFFVTPYFRPPMRLAMHVPWPKTKTEEFRLVHVVPRIAMQVGSPYRLCPPSPQACLLP